MCWWHYAAVCDDETGTVATACLLTCILLQISTGKLMGESRVGSLPSQQPLLQHACGLIVAGSAPEMQYAGPTA